MTQNAARAFVVVPAGGRGVRMGQGTLKPFRDLGGIPLIVHTLRGIQSAKRVDGIVLVVPEAELAASRALLAEHRISGITGPVAGGSTRQASVLAGLAVIQDELPDPPPIIAIHDAVRPFVNPDLLDTAIERAATGVGVVIGAPVHDTVKQVDGTGRVTETPDRTRIWRAFTPQVFPTRMIMDAYERAFSGGITGTDDASLVEHFGGEVEMLEGKRESLKITTPDDLLIARAWLRGER